MKYEPITKDKKVYSTVSYNVIEGEKRIAIIQISFYMRYGKKDPDVYVARPRSLRHDPKFKEGINRFAKELIKEYDVVVEDGVSYWVKNEKEIK